MQARQEEKEATSARRALEKELERVQVSPQGLPSSSLLVDVATGPVLPGNAFHLCSHPELFIWTSDLKVGAAGDIWTCTNCHTGEMLVSGARIAGEHPKKQASSTAVSSLIQTSPC